jgi:hypothetical protein
MPARVILVVEDQLSLAVAERLVEHAAPGTEVAMRQVVRGRDRVRAEVPKYVNACCVIPHFVLVDLDSDPCPRALLEAWKVFPPKPGLLIRVVPREVEAWVLADRPGFASFASVPMNKLPHAPETLADAKQTLINLARRSKSRRLASELALRRARDSASARCTTKESVHSYGNTGAFAKLPQVHLRYVAPWSGSARCSTTLRPPLGASTGRGW